MKCCLLLGPAAHPSLARAKRARDTKLKREVALKVLPDAFLGDPDRLSRFQREAEVLAALNHPNIAAIYGLEQSTDTTAIVLELVEGETLAQKIARERLSIDEALVIALQIGDALEAAHEGIIHRDLKPANIKLTPDGKIKVLDFGLAKVVETAQHVSTQSPTLSVGGTHAGVILGTASYMSPEQARGRAVDRRTDVWAFGCVLFEMLTGQSPFETGETVSDAVAAILKNEPRWPLLPESTPAHVRRLLRRCLQKDPHKRLPHIGVARLEIEEGASAGEVAGPTVPLAQPSSRARAFAMVAILMIIVGGVLGAVAFWRLNLGATAPLVMRFSLEMPDGIEFTNPGRHLAAMSPDGTKFVFSANRQLYLRSLSEADIRPIAGTSNPGGGVLSPTFSPGGQSIAFVWGGPEPSLRRISVSGGEAVSVCSLPAPNFGLSWDRDAILIGQDRDGILRVSATGGVPELIVRINSGETAHGPQMLPDGRHVFFTLATGLLSDRWEKARIVVHDLHSGTRKVVIEGASDARYLSIGALAFARRGTVFAVPFDLRQLSTVAEPVAVIEGVQRSRSLTTAAAQWSVSRDGSVVFWRGPAQPRLGDLHLAWVDRKGAVETLKIPANAYSSPRVSPDGKRLAVQIDDENGSSIWTYDLSGARAIQRLSFEGNGRYPIWAGDSEHVIFQSDRDGSGALYRQRADGAEGAVRLTTPTAGETHVPDSWALHANRFSYEVVADGQSTLWTYSMVDRKGVPFGTLKTTGFINSAFSPDGRAIAYNTIDDPTRGLTNIYIEPFPPTGSKSMVGRGFNNPFWSVDGKELIYSVGNSNLPFEGVVAQSTPPYLLANPVVVPRAQFTGLNTTVGPRQYDVARDGRIIGLRSTVGELSRRVNVVLNWSQELQRLVPSR